MDLEMIVIIITIILLAPQSYPGPVFNEAMKPEHREQIFPMLHTDGFNSPPLFHVQSHPSQFPSKAAAALKLSSCNSPDNIHTASVSVPEFRCWFASCVPITCKDKPGPSPSPKLVNPQMPVGLKVYGASATTSIPKSSRMESTVNGHMGTEICAQHSSSGSSHLGAARGLRSSSPFCHCQQGMARASRGSSSFAITTTIPQRDEDTWTRKAVDPTAHGGLIVRNMKLALLLCGGCFSQSALLEHLSAEDPWEAFGDIIFMSMASWVCSVLSPPSPQPSTVGHLGTDAVGKAEMTYNSNIFLTAFSCCFGKTDFEQLTNAVQFTPSHIVFHFFQEILGEGIVFRDGKAISDHDVNCWPHHTPKSDYLGGQRPKNGARAADTRGNEGRWEAEQLQPPWVVPLVGQMEEEDVSF
ncbi:hypothetical protein Q9966_006121 [Columba livia]|nr:hypothetical protein Q9966_006121 [Columba livia]